MLINHETLPLAASETPYSCKSLKGFSMYALSPRSYRGVLGGLDILETPLGISRQDL